MSILVVCQHIAAKRSEVSRQEDNVLCSFIVSLRVGYRVWHTPSVVVCKVGLRVGHEHLALLVHLVIRQIDRLVVHCVFKHYFVCTILHSECARVVCSNLVACSNGQIGKSFCTHWK